MYTIKAELEELQELDDEELEELEELLELELELLWLDELELELAVTEELDELELLDELEELSLDELLEELLDEILDEFDFGYGISFKREDNKVFDVYNVFPGEVISVSGNAESLEGFTISIKHDNDLTSTYSSLSSVNVSVGDILKDTTKIGVSGTTEIDSEAGVHVFVKVTKDGTCLNPEKLIGKKISEI